jgi:hypothetical protein
VKGLARMMLRVMQTKTNETFAQAENLLGQASEVVLKAMLKDCSNKHEDSVEGGCPSECNKII